MSLKSDLVKLAHDNPELRPHLVPLLKRAAVERVQYTVTINVPKASSKEAQKKLDAALNSTIKEMGRKAKGEDADFWKGLPAISSKLRS